MKQVAWNMSSYASNVCMRACVCVDGWRDIKPEQPEQPPELPTDETEFICIIVITILHIQAISIDET